MRSLADWLAYQERLHSQPIELGLERVAIVAERLGALHPAPVVITVTGTNGKGSSVALLEAILRAAGYRVGAYTSPHLLRYTERIRLDGLEVDEAALCESFERVETARAETSLTYFEFGTLAAFDVFTRAGLDVAILEVGMGGRLDAVNIVDPDVALVTNVGLDHQAWLGTDREAIAREKAGIFRAGRPAVFGEADVPRSVEQRAAALGAPLHVQGRDFGYEAQGDTWSWWSANRARRALPLPALRGPFQLQNATGALMALELVADRLPVGQAELRDGLLAVSLPGRLQALPSSVQLLVDVAHNPHGAHALADALRAMPCRGRTHAVVAMLADKDIEATLAELAPLVSRWYGAGLAVPRGADAERMGQALRQAAGNAAVELRACVNEALRQAEKNAAPLDRIILFGSFYTVAAVLAERV